ncbi:hypothetical protein CR513_47977, partial [Mucuna pruriens]
MLNGTNFKVWKETVEIVLICMDLDLALRVEEPILTLDNLQERFILEAFRDSISESQIASRFLEEIKKFFTKNEKVETSSLLAKLIFMKYKCRRNIREYVMEVSNLAAKLKSLKLELDEDLIVHLYGYLYLIHEKSQSLDIFKSFKAEVELHLGKKIKVVKFDCGGEHYEIKLKVNVFILNSLLFQKFVSRNQGSTKTNPFEENVTHSIVYNFRVGNRQGGNAPQRWLATRQLEHPFFKLHQHDGSHWRNHVGLAATCPGAGAPLLALKLSSTLQEKDGEKH